jgi:hypothetical protein
MAVLSKNETELARFNQLKASYSIRSNGKVLRNEGFGWKVCTLKEGWTQKPFARALRKSNQRFPNLTAFTARPYRRNSLCPCVGNISPCRDLLGDDLDGIYSDLQDRQIYTDLDTLRELHDLHQTYRAEFEARKAGKVTA